MIGIDNFRSGVRANLENAFNFNEANPGRFRLISLDVQAPELSGIVAGANPDIIFHLAAQVDPAASVLDPQFDARSNVLGTINLCEASRLARVRRIVYAGCGESQYGTALMPSADNTKVHPLSPYAAAKLAGEMYLRAYAEMYDLSPICLALGDVYGPRQHPRGSGSLIAALAGAMITGCSFGMHRDRVQARDYIYIDDAVESFVRAGFAPIETTGTYHIDTGQYTTPMELYRLISAVLDGTSPPTVAAVPADERSTSNPTTAERGLGWQPAVSLRDGIQRTVRWLCSVLEPEAAAIGKASPRALVPGEWISPAVDLAG